MVLTVNNPDIKFKTLKPLGLLNIFVYKLNEFHTVSFSQHLVTR